MNVFLEGGSKKDDELIKAKFSMRLSKVSQNLRLYKELVGYNHNELLFAHEVSQILEKYRG